MDLSHREILCNALVYRGGENHGSRDLYGGNGTSMVAVDRWLSIGMELARVQIGSIREILPITGKINN